MKAKAKYFKGIEFVVETELPENQQALLRETNAVERIKILIDGKIVSDCISFEAYSVWYHSVWRAVPMPASNKVFIGNRPLEKAS